MRCRYKVEYEVKYQEIENGTVSSICGRTRERDRVRERE